MSENSVVVEHRPDLQEYHLVEGGTVLSTVGYDQRRGTVVLMYTVTPEELRHRGHAGRLVEEVLARLAREHVRVVVRCPFARRWQAGQGPEHGGAIDAAPASGVTGVSATERGGAPGPS